MSELRQRLLDGPPLILDGGLGSLLLARGLGPGTAPEQWNLDRPAEVAAVHHAYVAAGSEAIHTNTFGASPIRLAAFGLADRCAAINAAAVALGRQAGPRLLLGDIGPTGEYLPPVGKGDLGAWRAAFTAQGRALAAAGVDGFHIETMSDLREALVALEALREVAPELPVLASLTFSRKRRGFFTVMGNPPGTALAALAAAGAAAVGANCSITSKDMLDLATEALASLGEQNVSVPVVLQPNAGQPLINASGEVTYDQDPAAFVADLAAMVDRGARAVGGCCGTDPAMIELLCSELRGPQA